SNGSPGLSKRCTQIKFRFIPTCGAAMPTPGCSESVTARYMRLASSGSRGSLGSISSDGVRNMASSAATVSWMTRISCVVSPDRISARSAALSGWSETTCCAVTTCTMQDNIITTADLETNEWNILQIYVV